MRQVSRAYRARRDRAGIGLLQAGLLILLLASAAIPARATGQEADSAVDVQTQQRKASSTRLSDWLLAHPAAADRYLPGLMWRVPAEMPKQRGLKHRLLKSLDKFRRKAGADSRHVAQLRDWIAQQPVTGRVPVPNADIRWLQANPDSDPLLQPDDKVTVPGRPATVVVLGGNSTPCSVVHHASRHLMDYVQACTAGNKPQVDWIWVVQPDGRIQRFGAAAWNLTAQGEAAPGAWIWAPARDEDWPEAVSARLVRFLATQGAAGSATGTVSARPLTGSDAPWTYGEPRGMQVTASDWGGVGLLQTPTARMRPAGDFGFNISHATPYTYMNVFLQPFDWLEGTFRYISISNRLYGPGIAGSQAYKDKSMDVKLRLLNESAYVPELAVGLRDIAGTGLFSGEYLVASKRTGDFDWSLGLGWGYPGKRGNLRNPLGLFSSAMDRRPAPAVGQGGTFSLKSYFRGRTSLFGGVQYQTPWDPLLIKLEYDGNNYRSEPKGNVLSQRSPINVGAVYRVMKGVDLSLAYERGDTVMLGLTLQTQFSEYYMPKLSDPAPVPVKETRPRQAPDWKKTGRAFNKQTRWSIQRIERHGSELQVAVDNADAGYWQRRVNRGMAVLHRDAPADIDRFTLKYRRNGMTMAEQRIDRESWVQKRTRMLPPSAQRNPVITRSPSRRPAADTALYERGDRPMFENSIGPGLNTTLGGPDSFMLYQLYLQDDAQLHLNDSTWLQGGVRLGVLDNYDKFKYTAPSNLPRVRTHVRKFLTTSNVTMPNLQLTHTGKVGDNNFYSLYGGYLEEMYAGVGGEWLYRPFESPVALGVDVNAVRMRSFRQDFALQNYNTITGHASLYWDTGWKDVQVNLSAGRYLARDVGASLEVVRHFDNGVTMGAGLTKTNVSARQFGEGSFDKWIRVTVPFDALSTRSSRSDANITWHPLLRDGGARLNRQVELYDMTRSRDRRTMQYRPAPPPNDAVMPEKRRESWAPPAEGIEPDTRAERRVPVSEWKTDDKPYRWRLETALYRQEFRHVDIHIDADDGLSIRLSNKAIHPISRAVGRAARTALLNAPLESRAIRITFLKRGLFPGSDLRPVVEYDFYDLESLKRYLDGKESREAFAGSVQVRYSDTSVRQNDPLALLADTTPIPPVESPFRESKGPLHRVGDDLANGLHLATQKQWLGGIALGSGLVLASGLLDKPAHRFATRHARSNALKNFNRIGNTFLPIATAAGASMATLSDDPRLSRAGYASLEAGGVALALGVGAKYAIGRARPHTGLGSTSFHPFAGSSAAGTDAFPSGHTVAVWSMITPFAEAYDMPWLYGVASLTNLSRVGSNKHWVSDTIAGSLLGYAVGKLMWEASSANRSPYYPTVSSNGRNIILSWDLDPLLKP